MKSIRASLLFRLQVRNQLRGESYMRVRSPHTIRDAHPPNTLRLCYVSRQILTFRCAYIFRNSGDLWSTPQWERVHLDSNLSSLYQQQVYMPLASKLAYWLEEEVLSPHEMWVYRLGAISQQTRDRLQVHWACRRWITLRPASGDKAASGSEREVWVHARWITPHPRKPCKADR